MHNISTDVIQLARLHKIYKSGSGLHRLTDVKAVVPSRWILLRECFEKLKFVRQAYISVDIDWRGRNHFNMLSGSFRTVENETSEPVEEETSTR